MFSSQKDGVSAQSLQRALEIGSYPTAWAMLHRLRAVLVRPGRDRLTGTVEVAETYFGGEEPGLRGGRQEGKKVLAGVAVELREPRGFGRCRIGVLTDASATSLGRFVTESVEPGSTLVTDGWSSYPPAVRDHYVHKPINVKRSGQPAHVVLPGVHRGGVIHPPSIGSEPIAHGGGRDLGKSGQMNTPYGGFSTRSESLGVPTRNVTLVQGPTSRRKLVDIAARGEEEELLRSQLQRLLQAED
jgi:hypothetical protein